jgi:hypothetical protein
MAWNCFLALEDSCNSGCAWQVLTIEGLREDWAYLFLHVNWDVTVLGAKQLVALPGKLFTPS